MPECLKCKETSKRQGRIRLCPEHHRKDKIARNADILDAFYRSGCVICKEKDRIVLEVHHINGRDPSQRTRSVSWYSSRSRIQLIEALRGSVPVCANCHKRITAGVVEVPDPWA